ncbi:Group II intron-encoded protein LtrA [Anatilimnocola aggregata]|uniref:RNA-directed DNA polymerase n=1 Tax=Anatilimnocola aggregata TaxID=2528021 RepID=A0A517Y8Q4_9BACT|nr:group II intron reverse transcriptase/maturase [Anatilimnocola aggregata]QDU26629.1 Group II intron-encoded protein LtrA [Anatilimnocola aggregata]QDU28861.1 Group II intron-encoded protein LtrA [Anatilimnocola aggregata]
MGSKRQKNQTQQTQLLLAFAGEAGSESPSARDEGTVLSAANLSTERPTGSDRLMECICDASNLNQAIAKVIANGGAPGVDGMRVTQLEKYFERHRDRIVGGLLAGTYRPQPVKRVEIPKPDGGVRKLGIPTVVDRVIQQAILQVLSPLWDATFSEHSFGFRPGRSAHQAIAQVQQYLEEGYTWVVDLDLEKFFDRVNHDVLMSRVARRVEDKRLLKLIRAFLNSGVMIEGLTEATPEGTPQGGPLSPLLSNLLLDELDRELESRGLRFARYADDCNVYVKSQRAGQRVLQSVTHWLATQLRLTVNQTKSAVDRPGKRKFLGFTFASSKKRSIAPSSRAKFKQRIRQLTKRNRGSSLERVVSELRSYLLGWRGYFGFCQTPSVLRDFDSWIHRRLRCYAWKQWRTGPRRFAELRRLGIGKDLAAQTAGSRKGYWHLSRSPALGISLTRAYFEALGLPMLSPTT